MARRVCVNNRWWIAPSVENRAAAHGYGLSLKCKNEESWDIYTITANLCKQLH